MMKNARDLSEDGYWRRYVGNFDGLIRHWIAYGVLDAEILESLRRDDKDAAVGFIHGEPDRAWLARIEVIRLDGRIEPDGPRLHEKGYPSRAQIQAAQADGITGWRTLAKHFSSTPTTIRRRLGLDANWKKGRQAG